MWDLGCTKVSKSRPILTTKVNRLKVQQLHGEVQYIFLALRDGTPVVTHTLHGRLGLDLHTIALPELDNLLQAVATSPLGPGPARRCGGSGTGPTLRHPGPARRCGGSGTGTRPAAAELGWHAQCGNGERLA